MKDPIKIIVENFPVPDPWYLQWIPVTIAILALVVSVGSLVWSIKQFRKSSRPYVWAINAATIDNNGQLFIIPEEFRVMISNSPARIIKTYYNFYYKTAGKKTSVHLHEDSLKVMFPSQDSQFGYNVPGFLEVLGRLPNGAIFERDIRIEYSSLSGNDNYYYESHAEFDSNDRIWRPKTECAE